MSAFRFILPALEPYIGERRFCAWLNRIPEGRKKPTKIPYGLNGYPAASTKPETWLSYEQAIDLWQQCKEPQGAAGGIGIFLGGGLCGIDLDSCIAVDLASWAGELVALLGAAVEISPSGTGLKAYLRCRNDDLVPLRTALDFRFKRDGLPAWGGTLWRQPGVAASEHGPGIELYMGERFFALTGISCGDGEELAQLTQDLAGKIWAIADALGGRPTRIGSHAGIGLAGLQCMTVSDLGPAETLARVRAGIAARLNLSQLLTGNAGPARADLDNSRSGKAFRLVEQLWQVGLSESDTIWFLEAQAGLEAGSADLLLLDASIVAWVQEKGLAAGAREIRRAYEHANPRYTPMPAIANPDAFGNGEPPASVDCAVAGTPSLQGDRQEKLSQRQKLIETANAMGTVFWHDPDSNAYVTLQRGERVERYRIQSAGFRKVLRLLYADRWPEPTTRGLMPGSVSDSAMAEAIPALEAQSLKGEERTPDVRVMRWQGAIWLDLGGSDWRIVKITAEGWDVLDRADVPLIRPAGLRPLPTPRHDPNALSNLESLLNLDPQTDQRKSGLKLVVAWLVATLYPEGPYAILAIDGENGSGKSTACRMLRRLVDPNKADVRAPPKTEDDLVIAAVSGRIVCIDNLSRLTEEMMDAICRLATGTGIGKRQLFTDGDEVIFMTARPVLLNGIPSMLARGDVADRSISATLQAIADEKRRAEADLWREFEGAAPGILGLLLDGIATALRNLPTLSLARMPRMADFARLACAAAPAFGWSTDEMLKAIEENRGAAVGTIIEGEPLAPIVQKIAAEAGTTGWHGTATALLMKINESAPLEQRKRGWPPDGARLSGRLTRIAPALRRIGVIIEKSREGHKGSREFTIKLAVEGD